MIIYATWDTWNVGQRMWNVLWARRIRNDEALQGVLGIQGEGLFIFRDLGRRVIYFKGFFGESGVLGSMGLRKNNIRSWGERSFFFQGAGSTDHPPGGGGSQRSRRRIGNFIIACINIPRRINNRD